jgi:hypothetical protein
MAVVEHKIPEFRSGETFMECYKDALILKELKSQETDGLPKDLGKSLDCKYEDI